MDKFLPYGRQQIDQSDIDAVVSALKSDWLTTGPKTQEFEDTLKRQFQAKHAFSCNSGTAALHLAMLALDVQEGDHVIVPSQTFVATANAVRYVGAEVIFCDSDPTTGLLDFEHLNRILANTSHPIKGIIAVHLNGQLINMEELSNIAREKDLFIVEDACHAIGGNYADKTPVGSNSHSDITVFSLHPVKTITMGEGGALTTNTSKIAEKIALFKSHGITRDTQAYIHPEGQELPWYYEHQTLGYNYRASDMQCALGLNQLKKLESFVKQRNNLVQRYRTNIEELGPILTPIRNIEYGEVSWHLFPILIDYSGHSFTRLDLVNFLKENNIGSQVHYIPVHQQPYYEQRYGVHKLEGAESYYQNVLSLPLFASMKEADVDYVCAKLKEFIALKTK
jgi:UDP-4-amino-4,6-dideoxy-N-acetyl-beta-L-altrosamine transaminase